MRRTRFALRTLAKTPVLSLVVVVSLGLGIGANTAIFSLLHQIILQSLPVERSEELVLLKTPGEFKSGRSMTNDSGGMDYIFSYPVFRALEKQPEGLAGVAGFRSFDANLGFRGRTVNGAVMLVSGGYFPVLGVKPLFGRLIAREDDVPGAGNPVAVLGFGYWKDRLGGAIDALNQPLRINGRIFTISGVTPPAFTGTTFGSEPQVYVPMSFKPQLTPGWDGTDHYDHFWIYCFARLKPGLTRAQAEGALNTVYTGVKEQEAKTKRGPDPTVVQRFLKSRLTLEDGSHGQTRMRAEARTPVFILLAATALVLLIAMANAANLLLARSAQRRRELAIRAALGAGRGDIMWQLLLEALILSVAGGMAGLVLAHGTLRFLIARVADSEAPVYFLTSRLEWPVLLFALGVSLLAGSLFGLYPAWDAACNSLAVTLKNEAGQTSAGQGAVRARKLLVCAQVMISAVLLIPTGLFLKSLVNLLHVDLGIQTTNLVTFHISPELSSYQPAQSRALFERVETQLAAIPGVRSVADALVPLISGSNWGNTLTVEGYSRDPHADTNSMFNQVGPGFFGKMGIPLIAGREFTGRDTLGAPKVALVNQTFARYFFGNGNPIGRKFTQGRGDVKLDIEIIGVAKDSHYSAVKQKPPRVYYTPWRQSEGIGDLSFYVRAALPPEQILPQIRRVMASLDRDLPLEGLRTMEDQVLRNIRDERMVLQLAAVFAVLATVLAMLGLYGVMAYLVTTRTREIGIRMALGAGAGRIRSMVMRELLTILAAGLVTGVPASLALARLTRSQLFGVEAYDASVVASAVLSLCMASLAAAYLPARRATRVNPLDALRYE